MNNRAVRRAVVGLLAVAVVIGGALAPTTGAEAAGTARITGTITVPAGEDVANVEVEVVDAATDNVVTWVRPDASGAYEAPGLDAGSYQVFFWAGQTKHLVSQWWDGVPSFDQASSIPVAAGATVVANATLSAGGGSITGTRTGVVSEAEALTAICAYRLDGGTATQERCQGLMSPGDGTYTLGGLRDGEYILDFTANGSQGRLYIGGGIWADVFTRSRWWNGQAGIDTADVVTIANAAAVSGIDDDVSTIQGHPTSPSISGTPKVGVKLTAYPGAWPTGTSKRYVWNVNMVPTVFSTSSTYTPTAADVGKTISVDVYGETDSAGPNTWEVSSSGETARVVRGSLSMSTPTITGTRAVGAVLTANHGTWTSGTTFSYAWYANGAYITGTSGPTHSKFVPTSAQLGKSITVKVTGTKAGYTTAAKLSGGTARIARTATPTITGVKKVGYTLYAHPGTWTTGTSFSYAWYANGVLIRGSSGPTHWSLRLASALRGKSIQVRVTGSKQYYQTISRSSARTSVIG